MQCPVDGATLVMTERSGVEIDYCPKCRGVWLDRGELDKIVAHIQGGDTPIRQSREPEPRYRDDHDEHDDRHYNNNHGEHGREPYRSEDKKRRGSFIGDIFGGFGDD